VFVSIESQLSSILGLWKNGGYLLVSDYYQQKVYQLKPDTGEVRTIPLHSCHPYSLAVDPSNNCFYVVCEEYEEYISFFILRHIRKITFDSKVDEVIYTATRGKNTVYTVIELRCVWKSLPFNFCDYSVKSRSISEIFLPYCSRENLQTHDIFLSYNVQFVYEYYRIETQ